MQRAPLQTLDQWQSWKKNREEQITFAMQCMTHFDKSDKDKEQQKHFQNIKISKRRNVSGEKWLSQGEIDALAFNRQPVPVVSLHMGPYNLFNF